jgi:hypothetical protein
MAQGSKINDSDFQIIILGSLPAEWSSYISTLYEQKFSAEVIAKLTMHDTTPACHRKPTSQTMHTLATVQSKWQEAPSYAQTQLVEELDTLLTGGGMEGQYPDWWKKKSNVSTNRNNGSA